MKYTVIIIVIFFSKISLSQSALVPYRIDNKFGLSDEKGKVIVKPVYDEVKYLKNYYFKYTNTNITKDTVIHFGKKEVRERKSRSYGLFYKDKFLINDQECSEFLIYKHFIIASINPYHAEKCVLYNLKGKQLTTEPVSAMYVNDKRDLGYMSVVSQKHTVLSIFHRDEKNNRTFSLAIYDNEQQEIIQWLITKVYNFKAIATQKGTLVTGCSYTDEQGMQEKYIRFKNNNFEVVDYNALSQVELEDLAGVQKSAKNNSGYVREENIKIEDISSMGNDVAVPDMKEESSVAPVVPYPETEAEKRRYTYYIKKKGNDSLFFTEPNSKELFHLQAQKTTYIKVPDGVQVIYINSASNQQFEQLIYKKGTKFGLLNRGVFSEAIYDSLLYFGSDFIAGSKTATHFQFGIVTATGKELLPIIHDSIQGTIKEFDFDATDGKSAFALKDKKGNAYTTLSPYWKFRGVMNLVYKNGKVGLWHYYTNTLMLPVDYDLVAENGMHYNLPRKSEFILLKKKGLYGITTIELNKQTTTYELKNTVQPCFEAIPSFYINDFYENQGFKLFGLYNDAFEFRGYANEKGLHYYKK